MQQRRRKKRLTFSLKHTPMTLSTQGIIPKTRSLHTFSKNLVLSSYAQFSMSLQDFITLYLQKSRADISSAFTVYLLIYTEINDRTNSVFLIRGKITKFNYLFSPSPAFILRYALIKPSISPSITALILPFSKFVRWSLASV